MLQKSRKKLVSEINVVPYIDVMLVLLVIFMITAPLLTQGVKVNLPQAQAQSLADQSDEPLIVSVDKLGQYYLNINETPNAPVPPQQLVTRVAAEIQLAQQSGKTRQVFVKGDKDANYGNVVQAMVLLQQAGVLNVGLITQPSEEVTA